MGEITIGGVTYKRVRDMDVARQFDVAARILPLIASGFGELVPLFAQLKREGLSLKENMVDRISQIIVPASRELQKMTNEDRRFLMNSCLSLVDRKNPDRDNWEPIWNNEANVSMFNDINHDLSLVLKLMLYVLQETFQAFFPESLLALIGVARG